LSAIYDLVQSSDFVEEIYQTDAKEFWHRSLAVLQTLFLEKCDRQLKIDQQLVLVLTHNPYTIPCTGIANFQTWVFTASKTSLLTTKSFPTPKNPYGDDR
jgi:hypothetical protein